MEIILPNNCHVSELKVSPKNWKSPNASVATNWKIHYTFFDPRYTKGFRRQVKGMNSHTYLKSRQQKTRDLLITEREYLEKGFNPFEKAIVPTLEFEVNPYSPFIASLWIAVEKVRVSHNHKISLKSVVRGVEKSARQLNIHNMPVKDVSMKYFNRIFEQCYKNNDRFTGSTQNRYKKSLHRIYKELFKMEAVDSNPLSLIERVRATKKARVMPTLKERKKVNTIIKKTNYNLWRAVQLFFHSGARESEFLRLQAMDVNLKTGECTYTIEKGVEVREGVTRPIKDIVLPLWKEILKEAKNPTDYLFTRGLKPGLKPIRREQFARRWRYHVKEKLGINVDLYSLKHLNTTEVMDELDKLYNPAKDVAKMNAHNEAMIISIYDKGNKERKDDKIKKLKNSF